MVDIPKFPELGGIAGIVGGIAGAVVGGFAGSKIGKGKGNTIATAAGAIAGAVVGNRAGAAVGAADSNSNARLKNAGLYPGARNNRPNISIATARFQNQDLRARLSLSPGADGIFYKDRTNDLLSPLVATDGVVWPYTPTINLTYTANYTGATLAHTNYAHQSYSHSSIDNISVIGQFTSNTPDEAAYVLAVINFLRASTKMFYGQDNLRGTPPPVLRFSAHGKHMFENIPVVVTTYTTDFTDAYDYMEANGGNAVSMVPTLATVSVTLVPIITRTQTTQFSLDKYARGDHLIRAGSADGAGGMP